MIISVINITWIVLFIVQIALIVFVTKLYRDKSREDKLKFMFCLCLFTCFLWILYKIGLACDKTFEFNIWNELPLQPCNTMIWLGLIAAALDWKPGMAYGFYVGTLCAVLANLMPETGFYSIPLFSARGLYWFTHWLVFDIGILFMTLGLIECKYRTALIAVGTFAGLGGVMHTVNTILRFTVFPAASYYYTYGNEDNFILDALMGVIRIPYVYLVPLMALGIGALSLETFLINKGRKLLKKNF